MHDRPSAITRTDYGHPPTSCRSYLQRRNPYAWSGSAPGRGRPDHAQALPYFEYCLVRDWIWIDLDLTPEQSAAFARNQRQPSLIFAHTVIYDSSRRFDVGDFVRTSPLYKWEEGFIFATLNSAYILLGNGVRKRATLETVASFF